MFFKLILLRLGFPVSMHPNSTVMSDNMLSFFGTIFFNCRILLHYARHFLNAPLSALSVPSKNSIDAFTLHLPGQSSVKKALLKILFNYLVGSGKLHILKK